MNKVDNIYTIEPKAGQTVYIGSLSTDIKFNINDLLFFAAGDLKIRHARVVGVMLTEIYGNEFTYSLELPELAVIYAKGTYSNLNMHKPCSYPSIDCCEIFSSMADAKKWSMDRLAIDNQRRIDKIEEYFNNFN